MANISPPSSILERTTEGFGAAGSLGYHDMPHSEIFLSALKCFLGKKKKNQSISGLPHPFPNIISIPYAVYTVASSLYISPPALCFPSSLSSVFVLGLAAVWTHLARAHIS